MKFEPDRRIAGRGTAEHQFREELRGVALDDEGRIVAVGDSSVKVFTADGELVRRWNTGKPGHCVALDDEGRVWVGEWDQVEVFDADGTLVDTWRDPDRWGLVTEIGFADGDRFLADPGARWIRRYDREGEFLNNIGDKHRKGGFHIPNGVVDFAIDSDGILHVANPGMHRVERYKPDGELLGHFGRFDGRDPAGFPGCCNPTNLALGPEGRVVVSEKAGPRVKVYDSDGQLLAIAADDLFDPAAKNMDLAVDRGGHIYVTDPVALEIRVLHRKAEVTP